MTDGSPQPPARFDPSVAWTIVTDSPLLGLSFAREGGLLLAWDDASHLYLIDSDGDRRYESRAPERILSAAISDDGSLVAVLLARSRLILLGPELEPIIERAAPSDATTLAVDPHGRFVAIATKSNETHLLNKYGKTTHKFETRQTLVHLKFVPSQPILLGAANYGLMVAVELSEVQLSGGIDAEILWEEKISTSVGRLACTGDGGMILTSCHTHGVQRYDQDGENEGSYHLGGTVSHAVPDFAGRMIAVATSEGEVAVLNSAGNVRWKTKVARGPIALEPDGLGRFLFYGLPTGEITKLDLEGGKTPRSANPATTMGASPGRSRPGSVRPPEWTVAVAQNEDQAESAVIAVLDEPTRIAVFTNSTRLEIYSPAGEILLKAPECPGVGRILRTSTGWIASATDRNLVLYDAKRNSAQRLELSLISLTHLVVRPETFGLAIIQERDRLGRATPAGRWVWRQELKSPVEDLAVGPGNLVAVTTDNGRFQLYDAAGEPAGQYAANPAEALSLVEAPDESPAGVAWVTLARRNQILRGHSLDARVIWESPVPWEAWSLARIGSRIVVAAPDGRSLSYDGSGHLRSQTRADDVRMEFYSDENGDVLRVSRQGVHLIASDLSGRVRWRAVAEAGVGPVAAARSGVAAMIGRELSWFPS